VSFKPGLANLKTRPVVTVLVTVRYAKIRRDMGMTHLKKYI
jgi:hypothetical protein